MQILTYQFLNSETKLKILTKQVKSGGNHSGGHKVRAHAASCAMSYLDDVGGI